jgi:hypothetical protein
MNTPGLQPLLAGNWAASFRVTILIVNLPAIYGSHLRPTLVEISILDFDYLIVPRGDSKNYRSISSARSNADMQLFLRKYIWKHTKF